MGVIAIFVMGSFLLPHPVYVEIRWMDSLKISIFIYGVWEKTSNTIVKFALSYRQSFNTI